MATVNDDQTPHNTPVFMAFDHSLRAYWASHPEAMHSRNIHRTGQVFIVLFEPDGQGGGLSMRATARQLDSKDQLFPMALKTFNAKRQQLLRETIPASYFADAQPQRLYVAVPEKLWVNQAARDENGHIMQDHRYEITSHDLL
jgi:hypothetical protein